jgi:HNH endonuclease/NUMOD4 motif-containing protein
LNEIWEPVLGFENYYEVSDFGRVRNLYTEKHLKPRGARYLHVCLCGKERSIHRLVLEAFVGPCPEGAYGLHKDDDTFNNKLVNLRWGTPKENQDQRHARSKRTRGPIMVPGDVSRIFDLDRAGFGVVAIARHLGLNRGLIPRILERDHRY